MKSPFFSSSSFLIDEVVDDVFQLSPFSILERGALRLKSIVFHFKKADGTFLTVDDENDNVLQSFQPFTQPV